MSESYKDVLKEAPQFFEAYQSNYTYEKRSGALTMAYISGVCNQKLRSANVARLTSDSGYAPLYENQAVRGIINYGVNILIDPFRQFITSMLQNTPGYEVYPTKEDDDKQVVAEKATELLKAHDDKVFNLKSKIGELYTWGAGSVGTAYLELYPEDTDIMYPVAGTEDDQSIAKGGVSVDEFQKPDNKPITKRKQKRLQTQVGTAWDWACSEDNLDCLMDNSTLQIKRVPVTLRTLRTWANKDAFDKIEKLLSPKTATLEDAKTTEVRQAKGTATKGKVDILTGDDRQIYVYHVFHKPDSEYKDGWHGVVDKDGNELFWKNTLPIPGIMPATQLNTNSLDAGEFLKRSPFDDARGAQVLYQGLFDSAASSMMLSAKPPMQRFDFVKTSSDKKNSVYIYPKQGETEVIYFEGPLLTAVEQNPALANALRPRPMETPQFPAGVDKMMEECKQAVLNITGQNLANVGSFPNADISGVSVQEQVSVDAMGQLPVITLLNDFWYRFRVKVLKAVRTYYTTEQIAYMLNDDSIGEAEKFKLEDLDDSYDVKICSTDGLPQTPQGKIRFYTTVMQIAPTPEEKYEAWSKIKEVIGAYGLIDSGEDIEEELAELENEMVLGDDSLISDMAKSVPAIDSLGNPVVDEMGNPVMEPLARQRVRKWANRFQNETLHTKKHKPLLVGPESIRNGAERTQLMAWHEEAHEEIRAIKTANLQEQLNAEGLQASEMRDGGSGEAVPANVPEVSPGAGGPPSAPGPGAASI